MNKNETMSALKEAGIKAEKTVQDWKHKNCGVKDFAKFVGKNPVKPQEIAGLYAAYQQKIFNTRGCIYYGKDYTIVMHQNAVKLAIYSKLINYNNTMTLDLVHIIFRENGIVPIDSWNQDVYEKSPEDFVEVHCLQNEFSVIVDKYDVENAKFIIMEYSL